MLSRWAQRTPFPRQLFPASQSVLDGRLQIAAPSSVVSSAQIRFASSGRRSIREPAGGNRSLGKSQGATNNTESSGTKPASRSKTQSHDDKSSHSSRGRRSHSATAGAGAASKDQPSAPRGPRASAPPGAALGGDSTDLVADKEHSHLVGAYWSQSRKVWFSRARLDGRMVDLGTYESPEQAHDAYVYATEWHAIDTSPQQDVAEKPVKKYVGVWYHTGPGTFEAVLEHNGQELSGGQYDTAEEAAAAHDALARMYAGDAAVTNFDAQSEYADWVPPVATPKGDLTVPTLPGVPLTLVEVEALLKCEGAFDLVTYDVRDKFEHFVSMGVTHVVFVSGRTVGHMRRMGDQIVKAITRRRLRPGPGMAPNWGVEGRAQDHWMIVDTGAVWVSIFDPEHRAAAELDAHFAGARLGDAEVIEDYDAWVEANPVPPAYQALLDRDEEDIARKYALKKLQKKAKAVKKAAKRPPRGGATK